MGIFKTPVRFFWCVFAVPAVLSVLAGAPGRPAPIPPPGQAGPTSAPSLADYGKFPLQIIPNKGQLGEAVAFYIIGRDKTLYFTEDGLTFVLTKRERETSAAGPVPRWVVKLDFVGANQEVRPAALEASGTIVSFFRGKPDQWKAGLAACSKIAYRDLWPGIDLVYSGTFDRMKYEFIVHPGADPSLIRLAYRGAETVALGADGRLAVSTPAGDFTDDRPVAYQDLSGGRRDIPMAYELDAGEFGFKVGDYDRSRILVLDPAVLVYCGYIGGDGDDTARSIAVDGGGNAYIGGYTRSTESSFPVTAGPDLTFNGVSSPVGPYDAFVAKVNASGTALEYCGYIGGASMDTGLGIAVDAAGCAYLTGITGSAETDFPATVGPDLTYNGGADAYVAKLNPAGTALLYCGYIGGAGNDAGLAIGVDALGQAYVTGSTTSLPATFPLAVGPDISYNDYPEDLTMGDAFVAKVNAAGTGLAYCGYIGGGFDDHGCGIAVDGAGCAYVTGYTQSRESTFPVTVGPSLVAKGADAFVAKVNAAGSGLEYCGFIGGQYMDFAYAVAVDASGSAYVTGDTMNDETTFPVLGGPLLTGSGAYVAKVKPDGTGLTYCGFIGIGTGRAIAVDVSGCAYITGETSSYPSMPVTVGPDLTPNGVEDMFVAKVNAAGTGFDYCGYIGGRSRDLAFGIATDRAGNAYVVGETGSPAGAPGYFPAVVGPDLAHHAGFNAADGFIAKVPPEPVANPLPVLTAITPDSCTVRSTDFTFAVEGANFIEGAIVKWHGDGRSTTFVSSTRLEASIDTVHLAVAEAVTILVYNGDGEISDPLTFLVKNPLPSLDSISPTSVTGGSPDFRMTLMGSDLFGSPVVCWNGVPMAMSGTAGFTEMWAEVPSSQIATGGNIEITISNPPPGGGTSNAIIFPVSAFTLSLSPASVAVNAGQSAIYTIQVTPEYGPFDAAVSFINNQLPKGCKATYSPASVTPGAAPVTATLTVTTEARTGMASAGAAVLRAGPAALASSAAGLLFLVLGFSWSRVQAPGRRRLLRRWLAAAALVGLFLTIDRCSGGGGDDNEHPAGTPAGTYELTLAGKSGSMTVPANVTLVVR